MHRIPCKSEETLTNVHNHHSVHCHVSRCIQQWLKLNAPSNLVGRVPSKSAMPLFNALTCEIFYIEQKDKQDVFSIWHKMFLVYENDICLACSPCPSFLGKVEIRKQSHSCSITALAQQHAAIQF